MDNGIEPDKPTIYHSDKLLISKFRKYNSLKLGTIATGDIFVADTKLKHSIKKEFGADAIDMESASIAQTAERNHIPVIVLRTISDGVNETTNAYKKINKVLQKKLQLQLLIYLKKISRTKFYCAKPRLVYLQQHHSKTKI